MKKIVVIGASSCLAEHCCLILAENNASFFLVARNENKLQTVKSKILSLNPRNLVTTKACSLISHADISETKTLVLEWGLPDILIIAQGDVSYQPTIDSIAENIEINAISPILWVETLLPILQIKQGASIAIFGSIAGDRGKASNHIYCAAKGIIEIYTQGLRQRIQKTGTHVHLIKSGPTLSPMTISKKRWKLAQPEKVAKVCIEGILNKKDVIYTSKRWWLYMQIFKIIPEHLYKKLYF